MTPNIPVSQAHTLAGDFCTKWVWETFASEPEKYSNQILASRCKQATVGTPAKLQSQSTYYLKWAKRQMENGLNLDNKSKLEY